MCLLGFTAAGLAIGIVLPDGSTAHRQWGMQRISIGIGLPLQVSSSWAGCAGASIKGICHAWVRYGYRRIHVLLRREGWQINQKKTRRFYRELGLQLCNTTPERRIKAKPRDGRRDATRPNETWAMDSLSMISWRPAARSGC